MPGQRAGQARLDRSHPGFDRHRAPPGAATTPHGGSGHLAYLPPVTFEIDRDHLQLDEQISIGIYGPTRCILDAFRLRHQEGSELAIGALRRWLSHPGSQPATLLDMARHFPHAEPSVRAALEILL